jgi:hypothetical protein
MSISLALFALLTLTSRVAGDAPSDLGAVLRPCEEQTNSFRLSGGVVYDVRDELGTVRSHAALEGVPDPISNRGFGLIGRFLRALGVRAG